MSLEAVTGEMIPVNRRMYAEQREPQVSSEGRSIFSARSQNRYFKRPPAASQTICIEYWQMAEKSNLGCTSLDLKSTRPFLASRYN